MIVLYVTWLFQQLMKSVWVIPLTLFVFGVEIWKLTLISKMLFCPLQKKVMPVTATYLFNGASLTRVMQYKHRGVIFTRDLSWSTRIALLCSEALKQLWCLCRTIQNAPKDIKLLMYKCLVCPIVNNAYTVWSLYIDHTMYSGWKQLKEKTAHYFIFRRYDPYFSPRSALYELKLEPLSVRRDVESLKFLHNLIHIAFQTQPFCNFPSLPLSVISTIWVLLPVLYTDTFKGTLKTTIRSTLIVKIAVFTKEALILK